jgi:hypothetical protein
MPLAPESRRELLRDAIECFMSGNVDLGKSVLRDYINGTVGFNRLSSLTHKPAKSLMRMFGPKGNPHTRTLCDVISKLQRAEGVHLEVLLHKRPPPGQ